MATYWENSCSFGLRYVSLYKYLIVGLVFSHLGFWSGNLFLIAPFPDLCLLVPFQITSAGLIKSNLVFLFMIINKNVNFECILIAKHIINLFVDKLIIEYIRKLVRKS